MMVSNILAEIHQAPTAEVRLLLTEFIRESLVEFLELDDIEEVAPNQSFADLGTDSMQATEFKLFLEKQLDCKLKTTLLFDYPAVDLLVEFLASEVLDIQQEAVTTSNIENFDQANLLAIVALTGAYPEANDVDHLWENVLSGKQIVFDEVEGANGYGYGRISPLGRAEEAQAFLKLSKHEYKQLNRQEKIAYQTITNVLKGAGLTLKDLTGCTTGVYMGVSDYRDEHQEHLPSDVPLPNKVTFHLNLLGPSQVTNAFCSSVYVALHQAVVAIERGECDQALVGGFNTINDQEFKRLAHHEFCRFFLSKDNCVRSFGDHATGFARSEGAGVLLIKPLKQAMQDKNQIHALIRGTAVYHGGRGFNFNAPNARGIKKVVWESLKRAGLSADDIDYIEAHGIGNSMADVAEIGAIEDAYVAASENNKKTWQVSSIKPTTGHPEYAAGIASLTKAVQAIRHQVIPGISGLTTINPEIATDSRLVLQREHKPWETQSTPRRVALCSYAIGGVNAQIILEEYRPNALPKNEKTSSKNLAINQTSSDQNSVPSVTHTHPLTGLVKEVLNLDVTQLDLHQPIMNYGFDSIKVMQLVRRANEQLGTQVKMGQVMRVNTFQEFLALYQPSTQPETLSQSSKNQQFTALIEEILGLKVNEVDPNESILNYGVDSIKVMQLVRRANEQLGTQVKMGQVMRVNTFQEFLALFDQNSTAQLPNNQSLASNSLHQPSLEGKTYPISEMQKGMWFLQKMEADSTRLNVPIYFHCHEKVELDTLLAAFEALLERNPILRTSFRLNDVGDITHTIHPTKDCLNIELMTLEKGQDLLTLGKVLLRQPFELDKPPLARLFLMTHPQTGEQHVLFIVHHIVIDGMSGVWLMQEYWKIYYQLKKGGEIDLSKPDTAYFDFVKWEQQYVASQEGLQDRQWWINQLQHMPQGINLPYDEVKPHEDVVGSGCEKFYIREAQLKQLKQLAKERNVNFSTLLLAIFKVFIHKISQQNNLAVITPVQGRPSENYEDSMGCYINIIVTNTQVAPDQVFETYLTQVRDKFIDGLDYLFYPFAKVVEGVGLNLSKRIEEARLNPLSISYTYQNIFDGWLELEDELQKIEPNYDIFQETGDNYALEVYDWRDHLQLNFKYKKSLFYAETIQHHIQYFGQLLNEIIQQPKQLVGQYSALPALVKPVEYPVLPDTSADYPKEACIQDLFQDIVAKNPAQIAIVGAEGQLTYQELDTLSGQLAHQLIATGATPDTLVGVCLPRSLDMMVAIMGILKAGAAYVPLDAAHPNERLHYMVAHADLQLLVTHSSLATRLEQVEAVQDCQLFFTDQLAKATNTSPTTAHQTVAADGLAYMIYTSGSTGKPKGVMVTHRGVINHSFSTIRQFGFTPEDRLLQFASISFDVFAEDVFPTLIAGATLVIMEDDKFIDPVYVKQTMQAHQVTLVNFPTAYWHTLSSMSFQDTALRMVLIGGEQAEMEHYKQWLTHNPDLPVMNTYGPTETTISVAYYPMSKATTQLPHIPIGQPYQNTQLYVLNEQFEQLPIGEEGELYIAGDGVARGYWKNEALTQEKFIKNPFNPDTRLYKSGDRAQWNADGQLVCLGRTDQQVKIRGFRIELGEIEQVLSAHPLVVQVVVVASKVNQNPQLNAFVIAKAPVKAETLTHFLKEHLPEYMIPTSFEFVDKFPLTVNGKVDRKKLSATQAKAASAAPKTSSHEMLDDVSQELIKLWQDKLGVAPIGVDDNFFEVGGHSLLGVQLVHMMNQRWQGSNLQVLDLMKDPTIRGVVQKIRESGILDDAKETTANKKVNNPYVLTLRPSIPTFIVPGMPGLSDSYLELAESLATDGPVYGLQMKGFVQGEAAQTVEEMAAHNIECIQQIHPQGKINLYAHSYGGTVLYEMLRQLADTAIEVNDIVLMDCGVLPTPQEGQASPLNQEMVSRFCKVMLSNAGVNDAATLRQVDDILENNSSEKWKTKMVALFVQLKVGGDAAFLTKMWEVVETSLSVDYAYDAPQWDYNIKFVIAEESTAWLDAHTWDKYYTNVEVVVAQGGHHTMLNKENCASWL